MAKFLSRSHENLLRYISYRAVLPFTQLQEVPLGSTPSPDAPRYRLDCPSRRQRRKRKTLALYFPMAKFLSRLHENLLRYISYRALLPFTQLNAITRNWIDGLHLLLSYVKGYIIFQCCNEKNDADYDRHIIHLPHTCHEDGVCTTILSSWFDAKEGLLALDAKWDASTFTATRSHENLLRYISYRAVLPFTQLQEVPLGSTPSPDAPRYRLDCPSRRQRRKRKTLALYFPMAKFLSRLHENLLRYISYRALLPFTQLNAITRNWIDGLHLLLSYVKGYIIFQCCNEKNDADYDRHVIHLPHTCHEDGLNHLVLDVEGCVVNLNVTEASASYAGVLIDRDGSMKWRRRKKRKLVIFLYFLCNINYSQRCRTFFAMSRVSPMTTFPNSG